MKGRILIDVPQTGHKAGDYADLDKDTAKGLIEIGAFDTAAPWPDDAAPSQVQADKPRRASRSTTRKDES